MGAPTDGIGLAWVDAAEVAAATEVARVPREVAIRELVARAADRGFAIAFDLLRDAAEAEDAVQEALTRAWVGYDDVREPAALPGWFFRVLINHCMRTLRRRARIGWLRRLTGGGEGSGDEAALADLADPARSPEQVVGDAIATGRLIAALATLPTMQRTVLILRFGHDLPIGEVARLLAIGLESAKTHQKRGLARLRDRIGGTP
jgi:RNA polymerase sigma factor (sigma-70 family)